MDLKQTKNKKRKGKKRKNHPASGTNQIGDFVHKHYHRTPHILNNIFRHLTSPFDVEQCRLVSSAWAEYVDNENVLGKTHPNGDIWTENKNHGLTVQQVYALPPAHSAHQLIYDPGSQGAVLFHSRLCSTNYEHNYANTYFNFMKPEKKRHTWPGGEKPKYPYKGLKPHEEPTVHNMRMVSRETEDQNGLQMYHGRHVLFLKDSTAYLTDTLRVYYIHEESSTILKIGLSTMNPTKYKKIGKLEHFPNGMSEVSLGVMGEGFWCLTVRIIENCDDNRSGSVFNSTLTEIVPGQSNEGFGFGPGLQLVGYFGIVSIGLNRVFLFKVPTSSLDEIELNEYDVSIGGSVLKFLKFTICNDRYIILTGKLFQTERVNVIRCFDTETGENVWTRIYLTSSQKVFQEHIVNVFCSGSFVFWASSFTNSNNQVQHIVHAWNSDKDVHLPPITMPKSYSNRDFLDQNWLELSPQTYGIPMRQFYTQESNPKSRKFGYSVYILSIIDGLTIKISKCIDLKLHDNKLIQSNFSTTFFTDKSGLNIYYAEYEPVYKAEHRRYKIMSISMKKEAIKSAPVQKKRTDQGLVVENVAIMDVASQKAEDIDFIENYDIPVKDSRCCMHSF